MDVPNVPVLSSCGKQFSRQNTNQSGLRRSPGATFEKRINGTFTLKYRYKVTLND